MAAIPNGYTFGAVSIGVVSFLRKADKILVGLAFRRISEGWYPEEIALNITDARGNQYGACYALYSLTGYGGSPLPPVGLTWAAESPIEISIPEIAPISKFEIALGRVTVPDKLRGSVCEKFDLDWRNLADFPDLDFEMKPEQVLTGREITMNEDVSMWLGEPAVQYEADEKLIYVDVPVTVENRDYNPRSTTEEFMFELQVSSGRLLRPYDSWLGEREAAALSKETSPYSFTIHANEDEQPRIVLVYEIEPLGPIGANFQFYGFLPIPGVQSVEEPPITHPTVAGKIAFVSDNQGNKEICVMDIRTRSLVNLTNHPAGDYSPVWSPDGSKLAFVSDRDGTKKIYIMDSDGENFRPLVEGENPEWFPQGTRLAFARPWPVSEYGGPGGQMFIIDANGQNEKRIAEHTGFWAGGPTVSPDGTRIAYAFGAGFGGRIEIVDLEGNNLSSLLVDMVSDPSFSPDGVSIAAHCPPDDGIVVASLLDGSVSKITSFGRYPSWSKDGNWIVFDCGGDIFITDRRGSTVEKIVERGTEVNLDASWIEAE